MGASVRRTWRPQTPTVHALLEHLHRNGFHRVPRPLGRDDRGREVLSFLDGEVVGGRRPLPAWVFRDQVLGQVGAWLRGFHDATRSFVPPPDACWGTGVTGTAAVGQVVGHHDASPENAVWRPGAGGGQLVGFVDLDLAAPADPLRDLAFVALTWVPLTAADVTAADGWPPDLDRGARLRALLAAYGAPVDDAAVAALLDAVAHRAREHADGVRALAESGDPDGAALLAEGVADAFDRAAAQLERDAPGLLAG